MRGFPPDGRSIERRPSTAHEGFTFVRADVSDPMTIDGGLDAILHLASPRVPPAYLAHPIDTLRVGSVGTERLLGLAVEKQVRAFLLASTSEVCGDRSSTPSRRPTGG